MKPLLLLSGSPYSPLKNKPCSEA